MLRVEIALPVHPEVEIGNKGLVFDGKFIKVYYEQPDLDLRRLIWGQGSGGRVRRQAGKLCQ